MARQLFRRCCYKFNRILPSRNTQKCLIAIAFLIICFTFFESNKIVVSKPRYSSPEINDTVVSKPVRIFCLILTSPIYFHTRTRAVHETWAPRCDRHFFIAAPASKPLTEEQKKVEIQLPIAPVYFNESGRKNLTQRIILALSFAYENYFQDFDWFVKADDDTYLIVENLREFLSKQDPTLPITFGYNFKLWVKGGYHSGGASYVLSRESLKRFYEAQQGPDKTACKQVIGIEDLEIGKCLRQQGVYMGKSTDEHNRELFHPFPFQRHFAGLVPKWLDRYAENPVQSHYNCCSDRSVSFHYVTPVEQYYIDFLLYRVRIKH